MSITKKGLELASKLAPAIGYTNAIEETCSKICRAAATLHRLNEEACNGHPLQGGASNDPAFWKRVDKLQEKWEARVERESNRVAKRLDSLVRDLPETDAGPWSLSLEGDPRGCSVIIAPEGIQVRSDSWGERNGVCIP